MSGGHTGFIWDVFISHASEDKKSVARPLANLLAAAGFRVWLDEGELMLGDSIREKIDHGLTNSRFAVLLLSKSFFGKKWPKAELDGVFSLEEEGETRILPIWHDVDHDDIKTFSPILASRLGVCTTGGLDLVRDQIVRSINAKCAGRRRDQPLFHGRLTKKILFSVPAGSVFITNTINPDMTARIAEQLEGKDQREELWRQIKVIEGTGRVCLIFRDWAGYRDHMASRTMWKTETDSERLVSDDIRHPPRLESLLAMSRVTPNSNGTTVRSINLVLEEAALLGDKLRGTQDGNAVALQMFTLIRKCGNKMGLESVDLMVRRDETYSRTGLSGLAILYDDFFAHTKALNLIAHFESKGLKGVAYYCALRESFPDLEDMSACMQSSKFKWGGLGVACDEDTLFSKYPNRGPSIVLDCLASERNV